MTGYSYRIFMQLEFSRRIFKKSLKYQVLSKSVQGKASCSLRTDVTKLMVAFRDFANAPKNASEDDASRQFFATPCH